MKLLKSFNKDLLELGTGGVGINLRPLSLESICYLSDPFLYNYRLFMKSFESRKDTPVYCWTCLLTLTASLSVQNIFCSSDSWACMEAWLQVCWTFLGSFLRPGPGSGSVRGDKWSMKIFNSLQSNECLLACAPQIFAVARKFTFLSVYCSKFCKSLFRLK